MIPRYSLPRMDAIWSEENRFRKMLDVELAACEALTRLGKIPKVSLNQIQKRARFDVERIKEIELQTNHSPRSIRTNSFIVVDEGNQFVTGDTVLSGSPIPPTVGRVDSRTKLLAGKNRFLLTNPLHVVKELEEHDPGKHREPVNVTGKPLVLAHDVAG